MVGCDPSLKTDDESSDEADDTSFHQVKKRVQRFSDSDSDSQKNINKTQNISKINNTENCNNLNILDGHSDIDSEDALNSVQTLRQKNTFKNIKLSYSSDSESSSRATKIGYKEVLSESESDDGNSINYKNSEKSKDKNGYGKKDSASDPKRSIKNGEQQLRMKSKRNKLRQKFQNLVSSRSKNVETMPNMVEEEDKFLNDENSSDASNDESFSMNKIKQKIKERALMLKSNICDPDTSDEENVTPKSIPKERKKPKSTKPTSPKPLRMSAKQAKENMQKIKSESSRMLREKEVTLPYHRPKALSLKDIMSRRKPALSSDGKTLPIKMNEDQLKQYAQLLEQRQKEMMELCKSDTEEEVDDDNTEIEVPIPNKSDASIILKRDVCENDLQIHSMKPIANNPNCIKETNITNKITEDSELKNAGFNNEDNFNTYVESAIEELTENDLQQSVKLNDDVECVPKAKESKIADQKELTDAESCNKDNYNINIELRPDSVTENITNNNLQQPLRVDNSVDNESKVTASNLTDESQLLILHYDSEKAESNRLEELNIFTKNLENVASEIQTGVEGIDDSSNDIYIDEIDAIIENSIILKDTDQFGNVTNLNPKLMGVPGMVIDLDESDTFAPRKLSGVELLKERFTYFAKLKTPEELERDKEKKLKPGTQHLKLKQELEEKIAEQRSLEWAKRLEEERQQQNEIKALRGEDSDYEDDIDKMEAKLEENNIEIKESSSEEEPEENDLCLVDKPRKINPMIDDEAEESDIDENSISGNGKTTDNDIGLENPDAYNDNEKEDDDDSETDSSDTDSEEDTSKPKKSRILKAFEDSDDEDIATEIVEVEPNEVEPNEVNSKLDVGPTDLVVGNQAKNQDFKDSQDDDLQLAQRHKSSSDDFYLTQDENDNRNSKINDSSEDIATQTFSIFDSSKYQSNNKDISLETDKQLNIAYESQSYDHDNLGAISQMCTGKLVNNLVDSQIFVQPSQSQPLGEEVLELCTGKFYDNQFVSPVEENLNDDFTQVSQDNESDDISKKNDTITQQTIAVDINCEKNKQGDDRGKVLKSILDQLDGPDLELHKPNKYFPSNNVQLVSDQPLSFQKKKLIIDSDDEANEIDVSEKKRKKMRKKKLENRALQLSDDEDGTDNEHPEEEYISDIEEDDPNKIVEYDSEENEIEVKIHKEKKPRKAGDFFEQEAELTSEDEWVGSGDEDEAGLDRMEREAGDDDVFHQGQLQRELGQIHMRDVLDQDKREVRLIQELLFEDGDLGGGGRQRKFRWRNADGEDETGTVPDGFADTQEEEFESEEQWRKQRHEREVFLRQMKNQNEAGDSPNVTVNRTSIIKANLCSKTMSNLLLETSSKDEMIEQPTSEIAEKKTKDVPNSKDIFSVFQQNYHSSVLSRGRGALARLAALATPLAVDHDTLATVPTSTKRNFVFAALTPTEQPKVTKRKADVNPSTPLLVKKMKTEEKRNYRSSLLEHLNC